MLNASCGWAFFNVMLETLVCKVLLLPLLLLPDNTHLSFLGGLSLGH